MSFFESSSHYYLLEGDGSIKSAYDYGLAEARASGAYPSITTVLKERANPALDRWKYGQLFDTMVNNPYNPLEDLEAYKKYIMDLSSKKGTDAASFGTRLHDALDIFPQITIDQELAPYVNAFAPEYHKMVTARVESEIMLADPDTGVAGRTDLIAETKDYGLAVIDYKTSSFKNGKASFWDSYVIQLAFYAKCYQQMKGLKKAPRIINCGINSAQPMAPQWKVYSVDEQERAYKQFLCIAYLWFSSKNYWPMTNKIWKKEVNTYNKAREAKLKKKG